MLGMVDFNDRVQYKLISNFQTSKNLNPFVPNAAFTQKMENISIVK